MVNVGQRIVVEIDWSQVSKNYDSVWLRISAVVSMYPVDNLTGYIPPYEENITGVEPLNPDFLAIIQFSSNTSIPTYNSTLSSNSSTAVSPTETNLVLATPVIQIQAPDSTNYLYLEIAFQNDAEGVNLAYINNYTSDMMEVMINDPRFYDFNGRNYVDPNWTIPTSNGQPSPIYCNFIKDAYECELPLYSVVDIFINNTDTGEHPFHFHGHLFWIVATSEYPQGSLNASNYLRRDTVSVAAMSWVLIRILANNPGIWMFHCHIEWHTAAGLFMHMVEAPQFINETVEPDFLRLCNNSNLEKNTSSPSSGNPLFNSHFKFIFIFIFYASTLLLN